MEVKLVDSSGLLKFFLQTSYIIFFLASLSPLKRISFISHNKLKTFVKFEILTFSLCKPTKNLHHVFNLFINLYLNTPNLITNEASFSRIFFLHEMVKATFPWSNKALLASRRLGNRTWKDKMYYRPISRDEINKNELLVQIQDTNCSRTIFCANHILLVKRICFLYIHEI